MANKTNETLEKKKNTKKTTTTKKNNTNTKKDNTPKNSANKTSKKSSTKKTTTTKPAAKTTEVKATTAKKSNTSKSTANKKSGTKKTTTKKVTKEKVLETTTPEVIQELHVNEPEVETITEEISKTATSEVPKTILGIELPSGKGDNDRRLRKKHYMKDALVFAIIIPVLDLFAMLFIESYKPLLITNSTPLNFVITLVIDFALIYIVTYLIDFVFGEDSVKKNNK